MPEMRLVATITIAVFSLLAGGCGEKDEPRPAVPETSESAPANATAPEPGDDSGEREDVLEQGDVPEPEDDAAGSEPTPAERAALATVRSYIGALDARDGTRACAELAGGALDGVELPRERGGCAESLEASIGYRDPRGLPVWKSAQIEAIASLEVDGARATVIPTVFTRFADRDEPSLEDDPVYLRRSGGDWLVEKPSLTLYRAIGSEPPLEALEVPGG